MSNNDWGFERMSQPQRPQEDVRNMPYTTPCTPQPTKVLRDERLERIATAVLAGLASVPNNSLNLTPEDVRRLDVEHAINYAKALVAELDKQA